HTLVSCEWHRRRMPSGPSGRLANMRGTCTNTGFALVAFFAAACGGGSLTAKAPSFEPPNPLGQGYLLIPLPSDDPSILGRVLRTPPTPGTNLEEMTQPNPCVEFLEPERASAQSADFVDAEDVSLSG